MSEGKRVDIDDYLSKFIPETQELARTMRKTVLEVLPDLDEVVKWGYLVYEGQRKVCSINVYKKHINLMIWRGDEIDDPEKLLEGEGKQMRHVSIKKPEDIKPNYFKSLLKQASELK